MNNHEDGSVSVGSGGDDSGSQMGSSTEGSNRVDDSMKRSTATGMDSKVAPLVHNETTKLSRARLIMVFVLIVSTVSTAVGCHYFLKNMEYKDFTVRVGIWKVVPR
jgi:hypothetical protein